MLIKTMWTDRHLHNNLLFNTARIINLQGKTIFLKMSGQFLTMWGEKLTDSLSIG